MYNASTNVFRDVISQSRGKVRDWWSWIFMSESAVPLAWDKILSYFFLPKSVAKWRVLSAPKRWSFQWEWLSGWEDHVSGGHWESVVSLCAMNSFGSVWINGKWFLTWWKRLFCRYLLSSQPLLGGGRMVRGRKLFNPKCSNNSKTALSQLCWWQY
jgi:hypothetical protein